MKTSWGYHELPWNMYSASVSGSGDRWMFRAVPDRGDWCIEGIYKTQAEACSIGVQHRRAVRSG